MQTDTTHTVFQYAVAFVTRTNRPLFVTGKAGTGKTTFLRYIRENCYKKMAVVAPTGVAAINAGGTTIHSFFQLPLGMYIPSHPEQWGGGDSYIYNKNQLLAKLHLNKSKRELIRELDLLVIDEVSMVRADLLDAVDVVLRSVRRRPEIPFGGVQMLYVGDLFQLPPVVRDNEKELFQAAYKSPFFFDASAVREQPPVYLELKKIYRQRDPSFIRLLNNIRNSCCSEQDVQLLHQYYQPGYTPSAEEGYITLTSHNYKADAINQKQLSALPGKIHEYGAAIEGEFSESAYPAPRVLRLKEGAQIMFIKNDKGETRRYYNGKIGFVRRIDEKKKSVFISFPDEPGALELELETWSNIRYTYDPSKDEIKEEEIGTFTQFPIRLAWAVTIHKSQGLTFDKAIVDAGSSFAAGQVYVALSRLTSLQGLILRSPIAMRNIFTDAQVLEFSARETSEEAARQMLRAEEQNFIHRTLAGVFDWKKIVEKTQQCIMQWNVKSRSGKTKEMAFLHRIKQAVLEQQQVADKFLMQLDRLFSEKDTGYDHLHDRVDKGASWFATTTAQSITELQSAMQDLKGKSGNKKYLNVLGDLLLVFFRQEARLKQVAVVTEALQQSLGREELMERVKVLHHPAVPDISAYVQPAPKEKGDTRQISLRLYKEGRTIAEIASDRNLTTSTIEGHLLTFIATGEVNIEDLVSPGKLKPIMLMLQEEPGVHAADIREKLGNDYSYTEIKAARIHWQNQRADHRREVNKGDH
jgi:hypothetical protein